MAGQVKVISVELCCLALLLSLSGCAGLPHTDAAAVVQATPAPVSALPLGSQYEGHLKPLRWAALAFQQGGHLGALLVREGETVTAGQPLARLKTSAAEAALPPARATLAAAKAELVELQAGPLDETVRSAEQALAEAQAQAEAAQAQAQARAAALERSKADAQVGAAQVASARAELQVARAELAQAQSGPRLEELTNAEVALAQAEAAVRVAQTAYDRSTRASDTPEALALEQATLQLEAAKARHNLVAQGPRAADVAPWEARVEAAKAQVALAEAQSAQRAADQSAAEANLAQAAAEVKAAQARMEQAAAALDAVRRGPTAAQLANAQAAVTRAEAEVTAAEQAHAEATLSAPFDGAVVQVAARMDEGVQAGAPVMTLADLTQLVAEVEFDERTAARLAAGQPVQVRVVALDNLFLPGQIISVALMPTPKPSGEIVYLGQISLTQSDPRLAWGMTVQVELEP